LGEVLAASLPKSLGEILAESLGAADDGGER
jgi:hypothetical protein